MVIRTTHDHTEQAIKRETSILKAVRKQDRQIGERYELSDGWGL